MKFKEVFNDIIIEGSEPKLQDFQRLLKKAKIPFDLVNGVIAVPSRFYKEINKFIEQSNGFKQNDARDQITIRLG